MIAIDDWIVGTATVDHVWFVKRLSGNDTHANGAHQAGPYIPKQLLFELFPDLNISEVLNPKVHFNLYIDSHTLRREVVATWYNNTYHGGTRNETRITNLGGKSSALLDPESTGSLTIFAFEANSGDCTCHVWVCRNAAEEDQFDDLIGPIEPGSGKVLRPSGDLMGERFQSLVSQQTRDCTIADEILPEWLVEFPSGREIVRKTVELRPLRGCNADERLLRRRDCEFELFQSLEGIIELPVIQLGFSSIHDFVRRALTVLQRRKARSGRSLELHFREILLEEGFLENADFSYQPTTEHSSVPDFIFPSSTQYHNTGFPQNRLRMLATKTTCKDRWRQILTEANRIPTKHLLTLQEGVSERQFEEMQREHVVLVVPAGLHNKFKAEIRQHLLSIEQFLTVIRQK